MKKDEETQKILENDVQKFSGLVYSICCSYTKCNSDADDVFQEVFIKYCKHFDKFKNDDHKENWLKKVSKHTALNYNKHKKISTFCELNDNIPIDTLEDIDECQSTNIFDYVKETYKSVLQLYYCNNLKIKEISKRTGLTECAVKTRLKRGRQALKEIVNKVGF